MVFWLTTREEHSTTSTCIRCKTRKRRPLPSITPRRLQQDGYLQVIQDKRWNNSSSRVSHFLRIFRGKCYLPNRAYFHTMNHTRNVSDSLCTSLPEWQWSIIHWTILKDSMRGTDSRLLVSPFILWNASWLLEKVLLVLASIFGMCSTLSPSKYWRPITETAFMTWCFPGIRPWLWVSE